MNRMLVPAVERDFTVAFVAHPNGLAADAIVTNITVQARSFTEARKLAKRIYLQRKATPHGAARR